MAIKPCFIALMNKSGIACAASADYTIHNISSKEPLAIAVNPKSKITWENIINRYKLQGEPEPQETLSGYADAFVGYLGGVTYDKKWAGADEHDSILLFLGYGCNDVYPSSLALKFTFGDDVRVPVTSSL